MSLIFLCILFFSNLSYAKIWLYQIALLCNLRVNDSKIDQKSSYCRGCWWRLLGGGAVWAVDVDGALALLTRWTCNWCICNCAASSPRNEHLEHCLLLCTLSTCVESRSARAALYSHKLHAKGFVWVFICRFKHQLSTPLHGQYPQVYLKNITN